ncbi:hypothetical protein [Simkania negevensis]|uniref:Fungal lipase-like domain-containing protein n=1 Tax=Simkania negevensis (strain ATCC VR-1471 / DSM 27360 / Z) TaxID=331113 RepID=F8L8D5_SIMNZ|nr:hypothetical protein [Simkania negevensis]CCB89058.1 unknown protein [Simkania negevensis Z]
MDKTPSDSSFSAQTFRYWEVFLSWLFKYPSRCYELNHHRECQVYENSSEALHQLGQSYRKRFASKGIICQVTNKAKDFEETCRILRLIHDEILNPELCDYATAEVLAKVLAYRELNEGDKIPIPTLGPDQTIHMSTFVVDKVFDLWSKIRAFGLVSADYHLGAPLLLFRGTDFSFASEGGRASIISDLDPKGPGRSLFENAEKNLHSWLKTVTTERGKARAIGHSLGGVIVAYTLLHEHAFLSNASHEISYAFNFPGVATELALKWEALSPDEKPNYRGFVCRGDVVSKFGQLFGNVTEVSLRKPLSPVRAHELLLFAEPMCYLYQVDLEQENRSSSRQFYSKLQQQTASMIYEFGLKFLFPNQVGE